MKLNHFLAFAFIFLGIMTYESCVTKTSRGGCNGSGTQYFRVKSLAVTNIKIDSSLESLTNVLQTNDTTNTIKTVGWRFAANTEPYCKNNLPFYSVFPTASADPAPPTYTCKERIDSLVITTVQNFDAAHLAGSKINDILALQWHDDVNEYNILRPKISVNELMSNINRPFDGTGFILYLRKAPQIGRTGAIKVHLKLSDGTVCDATSALRFVNF